MECSGRAFDRRKVLGAVGGREGSDQQDEQKQHGPAKNEEKGREVGEKGDEELFHEGKRNLQLRAHAKKHN